VWPWEGEQAGRGWLEWLRLQRLCLLLCVLLCLLLCLLPCASALVPGR
jgi:hypothetical protein